MNIGYFFNLDFFIIFNILVEKRMIIPIQMENFKKVAPHFILSFFRRLVNVWPQYGNKELPKNLNIEILEYIEKGFGVIECIDYDKFCSYMDTYLLAYQNDEISPSTATTYCSYKISMSKTLEFLKKHSLLNPKIFYICATSLYDDTPITIDNKVRLYEDLLILQRKGFIEIDNISLPYRLGDDAVVKYSFKTFFGMRIKLLQPMEYMEKNLADTDSYLDLSVNKNNKVFYQGNEVSAFSSNAKQQIDLLKFLIDRKGMPATREAVYSTLGYTMKSKKAPKRHNEYDDGFDEIEMTSKRGPKINKREAYRDRFKKLVQEVQKKLPDGSVIIKNTEKEGVFLVSGETKVSRK